MKKKHNLRGEEEVLLFSGLYLINNNVILKGLKVSMEGNGRVLTRSQGHFDVGVKVLQPHQVLLLQPGAWGNGRFHFCFVVKLSFFIATDLI